MYQVVKVLNNNGILALNLDDNCEYIFIGKGIGFHHKLDQTFEQVEDAKRYKLQDTEKRRDSLSVVNNVDPIYLDIANEIIVLSEKKFGSIDNSIMLVLADHIAFAVERIRNNLVINNPFTADIRALFLEEYEIALEAKKLIEQLVDIEVNEEEVAYITLHVHSALTSENVSRGMSVTILVSNMIERIEKEYEIKIDKSSLSYNRLMTHIKYMITRALKNEALKVDMSLYVQSEFPDSYEIAKELCEELSKEVKKSFSSIEVGYLAIHIERLKHV